MLLDWLPPHTNNSSPFPSLPCPWRPPFSSQMLMNLASYSVSHHQSLQHLSRNCLISLSLKSSRCIYIVLHFRLRSRVYLVLSRGRMGLMWLTVWRCTVHYGWEGMVADIWSGKGHLERQGENAGFYSVHFLSFLFSFYSVQIQCTVRCCLFLSNQSRTKHDMTKTSKSE